MQTLRSPGPRIAVLNASFTVDTTRRNFFRELDAPTDAFHCPSGEFPAPLDYDAVVITGSGASVYWDRPWINRLEAWVRRAVAAGRPCLGVCFGHQLLAQAIGGDVEDMGEYEIGYRTVEHDGESPLFTDVPRSMTVFTTHSDRVTSLPAGATVCARNDYGIQGFRQDHVHGVQFHPEYDMDTAEMITRGKDDQLSSARIRAVLRGIHEAHYRAARKAKRLFDNFLDYVDAVRAVPALS